MNVKFLIHFKKSPLFIFFYLLIFAVMTLVAVITLKEGSYALSAIAILINLLLTFALWCRFFAYGLRINKKRIIAIDQTCIKILLYNTVSRITVKFTHEAVSALIKTKDQNEYYFVWDSIFLGSDPILPNRNKAKITPSFVEKSISELSKCDKVRIQNYFV